MRLLICGDRHWADEALIEIWVRALSPSLVIHGGAPGVDSLAGKVAEKLGIPVKAFPAQWGRFGRGAGPIRNQQMLDEGKPNHVLAFHDNIDNSRGTADMLRRAKKAGLTTQLISGA